MGRNEKNQYFIDVLNTVSGVTATTDSNISHDYKAKYSFVYSILMNIRWHELSLLQRLNTILLIEGGCSKQVQIIFVRILKIILHCNIMKSRPEIITFI